MIYAKNKQQQIVIKEQSLTKLVTNITTRAWNINKAKDVITLPQLDHVRAVAGVPSIHVTDP